MRTAEGLSKYQPFVNDYNSGMNRAELCGKYRLAPEKFDPFLEFLRSKGFVLVPPLLSSPPPPAFTCPKCGYVRSDDDAMVDAAQCPKCQIIYAKWSPEKATQSSSAPSGYVRTVNMESLTYKHEEPLFKIHVVLSSLYWLSFTFFSGGLLLFALPASYLIFLFAQSALLTHLKGNGIKLSPSQLPDLYQRQLYCCKRLGIDETPDVYVINGGGLLNAFAARFLGRNFVVLYSNVLEGMADHPEAINFYLGHELGHIRRNHLFWGPFLWPTSLLPLIGAAYSRAREYTCDQFGSACCDSTDSAMKGLVALAAGERLWATINIPAYLDQANEKPGFWMSFHELHSSYPWLMKRAARIQNPLTIAPERSTLAWVVAFFIPRMGFGGSLSGLMVVVAIVGILAAIAIPQFQQYRAKAQSQHGSAQQTSPDMDRRFR